MTARPLLWIDNSVLNYLCKAGCLQRVLSHAPFQFVTTAFIQQEAENGYKQGVFALRDALDAFATGQIPVYDTDGPPLNGDFALHTGLGLSDESLILCAQHYGGAVLTNDGKLLRHLEAKGIDRMPFGDFLAQGAARGWLAPDVVHRLKLLAGLL